MLRSIVIMLYAFIGTAAVAQGPANGERAADARDKMICKKFLETGSLVRNYRICKTKAEWARDRDLAKAQNGSASCRLGGEGGSCG